MVYKISAPLGKDTEEIRKTARSRVGGSPYEQYLQKTILLLCDELEEKAEQAEWPRCADCNAELQDLGYGYGKVCPLCESNDKLREVRTHIEELNDTAHRAHADAFQHGGVQGCIEFLVAELREAREENKELRQAAGHALTWFRSFTPDKRIGDAEIVERHLATALHSSGKEEK